MTGAGRPGREYQVACSRSRRGPSAGRTQTGCVPCWEQLGSTQGECPPDQGRGHARHAKQDPQTRRPMRSRFSPPSRSKAGIAPHISEVL